MMLTNDAWDMASYHRQDLMAEADGERLVAMLPQRSSVRQALARLCYRLAGWLDAPAPKLRRAETCAEEWAAPIAGA